MLFKRRSSFQEKDLCCLSLSSFSCQVSSFCKFTPKELGSSFVRVCFRRCHCAPSMHRGPQGKFTVAMPCVVAAWTGPEDVSQDSGSSKIRTTPIAGPTTVKSRVRLLGDTIFRLRLHQNLDPVVRDSESRRRISCGILLFFPTDSLRYRSHWSVHSLNGSITLDGRTDLFTPWVTPSLWMVVQI